MNIILYSECSDDGAVVRFWGWNEKRHIWSTEKCFTFYYVVAVPCNISGTLAEYSHGYSHWLK